MQQTVTFFYANFNSNVSFAEKAEEWWTSNFTLTNATIVATDVADQTPPTWALALCSGLPLWWRLGQNCHKIYKVCQSVFTRLL